MPSCYRQKGSAGMRSWGCQWLVGVFSAYRLSSRLSHEQLGREEGNPALSEKVVPITRNFLHYMEPSPHAVKRKNGEDGSHNGRYRNRFQKWLRTSETMAIGQLISRPCREVALVLPVSNYRRRSYETGSRNRSGIETSFWWSTVMRSTAGRQSPPRLHAVAFWSSPATARAGVGELTP